MRIVIDMQGVQTGSRYRGIGRYTASLVKAILSNHKHHEYILLFNGLFSTTIESLIEEFNGLIDPKNCRIWHGVGPVYELDDKNAPRQEVSCLIRESYIESLNADIVLITSLFEGYGDDFVCSIGRLDKETPTALIFYDLIPFLFSDIYLANEHVLGWYNSKIEQAKKADLFLNISESTKSELIEHLGVSPERAVNISAASDDRFYIEKMSVDNKAAFLARFGLTKPYLMYLSATDWRKNHKRLIEAYSKLPASVRSKHQLCLVGGLPKDHEVEFIGYAKQFGLEKHEVILSGHVSDEEINTLLNLCKAFIFPSWHEGFGLPVLEAMQCGRAVIGANTSSLPEIIGREDAMFDPFSIDDMCERIHRILSDCDFRDELEVHSLKRAANFSWENSARLAIDAIESFVNEYYNKDTKYTPLRPIYTQEKRVAHLVERIASLGHSFNNDELHEIANSIARNELCNVKGQLLIDISELVQHDAKTGIQRVVRNILQQWIINPPNGFDVKPIYATQNNGYKYANSFVHKFMGSHVVDGENSPQDTSIEFTSNDIFIGLDLIHPEIASAQLDFYEKLKNRGVRVLFIVYDILPLQFPQYCNTGVPEGFSKWLDIICKSDELICISKATANDLSQYLHQSNGNLYQSLEINWFHLGAKLDDKNPKNLDHDLDIPTKLEQSATFLMVGTIEPRKAQEQVLDAFELLWKSSMNVSLVIIGKYGWTIEALIERIKTHPRLNKQLFWLDSISDAYLEKIYSASTCLIAASEGEGFGLPLIEAAQHKLPIIARDIPVFREVAGDHALYFENSKSPQVIAQVVTHWLDLNAQSQSPQSVNMPWLTWEQSAQNLLDIIMKK